MKKNHSPSDLNQHILQSYSTLRWFMFGFGLVLPLLLVVGGLFRVWWLPEVLTVQNSLSAYYHAGSDCIPSQGVYRNLFVGLLAAISCCLIIYSGFGKLENWLLKFAGVFLGGVAFFPTDWPESQMIPLCQATENFQRFEASKLLGFPISIHNAAAILFFITITVVNIFTAQNTVRLIEPEERRHFWKNVYNFARYLMPISLGLVLLVHLITGSSDRLILWIEWAGIWAFSLYWLLKSIEIFQSKADIDIIQGNVTWRTTSLRGRRMKRLQRLPDVQFQEDKAPVME